MEIIGYHYSSEELNIGDIIKSSQHRERMFPLVHGIFKQVNPDLFDTEWGYAYPERKDERMTSIKHCYLVKADSSRVIKGNFDYSVYYSMGCCQTDNSLPLKERLLKREENLRERARLYFAAQDNIELISDSFIITEKLY
jgi:hypothetical protein